MPQFLVLYARASSARAILNRVCRSATIRTSKAIGEPARLDRLPRRRLAQIVADHLGYGWSAEEIVRQYPHLAPAEVRAYYFDHREEIDAELAAELAELDRMAQQPPSPLRLRLLAPRRGEAA